VELPDDPGGLQFACPHCGGVIGGAPPVPAQVPPPELPPLPPSLSNEMDRDARAAAAAESARTRTTYRPTTGRTDTGEALAMLGITLSVPAIFASPWLHPLALGAGGMVLCLIGLVTSRRKVVPIVGIVVGGLCAATGVVLHDHMVDLAVKLGMLTLPEPPPG